MAQETVRARERRSLDQWRVIVDQFRASGQSVAQFCDQEPGVSRARLNHWRRLLAVGPGADEPQATQRSAFVDAGVLGGGVPAAGDAGSAVTVRLDLGGGVVLTVSRT